MTDLIGTQPIPVKYDRRAGQYRGGNGQFVPRAKIESLLNQEIKRTEARLQAQTRLMIAGRLDLPQWQRATAQLIKDSHLRMGALSSGGRDQMTSKSFGAIGFQLRTQFKYLDNFARDLHAGKLTPSQAVKRSGLYAESVRVTFSRTEQIAREDEGVNAGKRILDSQSQHCDDCLRYQRLDWVPISEIVAVGTNCRCYHHCRCRVVYGRVSAGILSQSA